MKKHKNKIIAGIVIVAVLVIAFFWTGGGNDSRPESAASKPVVSGDTARGDNASSSGAPENTAPDTGDASGGIQTAPAVSEPEDKESSGGDAEKNGTGKPASTQPPPGQAVPPESQAPQEPPGAGETQESQGQENAGQGAVVGGQETQAPPDPAVTQPPDNQQGGGTQQTDDAEKELTVTLVISCATILNNMDRLADGKAELIPADGIVFSGTVIFYEGESVFNVLQRETRKNRIHLEFTNTPIYNSAYIEGINNIYEFEVGERSGWMYSVNGVFPNYGSSRYALQDGDAISWLFTCDRGDDIGGGDASGSYGFGG